MRSMDAAHFETFFECSASSAAFSTISQLQQWQMNANNYSLIDDTINKRIIELKQITNENSIAQLTVVKLIYICKTLMEDTTFPKGSAFGTQISAWFVFALINFVFILKTGLICWFCETSKLQPLNLIKTKNELYQMNLFQVLFWTRFIT